MSPQQIEAAVQALHSSVMKAGMPAAKAYLEKHGTFAKFEVVHREIGSRLIDRVTNVNHDLCRMAEFSSDAAEGYVNCLCYLIGLDVAKDLGCHQN